MAGIEMAARRPPVHTRPPRSGRLARERPAVIEAAVPRVVLASASPARLALLRSAGIEPEVIVSHVDESAVDSHDPAELAGTLAGMKAETVAATMSDPTIVVGCDSVLAFDGEIMGKPADAVEARDRWRRMRGRSGVLHTGHCLIDVGTGKRAAATSATTVHFAQLTDDEIDAYVATGEPLHVAGAFTIDGLGGAFVTRIEGDHGTVVGLSLPLLRDLLGALGVPITGFWQRQ
jgi:septum formation protein